MSKLMSSPEDLATLTQYWPVHVAAVVWFMQCEPDGDMVVVVVVVGFVCVCVYMGADAS
jgi:hypothetical protein